MDLTAETQFSAAHHLPKSKGRCRNPHGHNYRLEVTVRGVPDPMQGWIVDFDHLSEVLTATVGADLDGSDLNHLLDNPTAEALVVWIWDRLQGEVPGLHALRLWETPTCSIIYRGEIP